MSTNFSVQYRKSNGNLHLRPKGDFDGSTAWELINLISEKYDGKGRVFIDTEGLNEVHPFGSGVFKCQLRTGTVPPDCLFFKGKKGFHIAPNGSRVIIAAKGPRCRCDANCENCRCSVKRDRRN